MTAVSGSGSPGERPVDVEPHLLVAQRATEGPLDELAAERLELRRALGCRLADPAREVPQVRHHVVGRLDRGAGRRLLPCLRDQGPALEPRAPVVGREGRPDDQALGRPVGHEIAGRHGDDLDRPMRGSFHARAIDALGTGRSFSFFFFESPSTAPAWPSRTPASERVGTAPRAGRSTARYSVSCPDLTQASISGCLRSFSQNRAACSVRTVNSYSPLSGARSDPSQLIVNSCRSIVLGLGAVDAEVELHAGVHPLDHPIPPSEPLRLEVFALQALRLAVPGGRVAETADQVGHGIPVLANRQPREFYPGRLVSGPGGLRVEPVVDIGGDEPGVLADTSAGVVLRHRLLDQAGELRRGTIAQQWPLVFLRPLAGCPVAGRALLLVDFLAGPSLAVGDRRVRDRHHEAEWQGQADSGFPTVGVGRRGLHRWANPGAGLQPYL